MPFHPGLATGLRADLQALSSGRTDRAALTRVVAVCHALATAFLRSKRGVRALAARNGLRDTDIAYDCLAELFQQDAEGGFLQLRAFFAALPLQRMTDEDALAHLRRLVFSRVNHGVFRICNEFDPGLGRILRNVKLAIQALRSFEETEVFGELRIRPLAADPLDHLRPPERGEIVAGLRRTAGTHPKIPDLLAALALYLREQCDHARSVPLMEAALAIREYFSDPPADRETGVDAPVLAAEDTRRLLREACTRVRTAMEPRYVGRGKITAGMFDTYFAVIEEGLRERFVEGDGEDFSYFEGLRTHLPDLDRTEYRKRYKSHMEYLGRVALRETLKTLKRDAGGGRI
jgi:hypothetical protein